MNKSSYLQPLMPRGGLPQVRISSLLEYLMVVSNCYKYFQCERRLFFRGHGNKDWDLMPSVFRNRNIRERSCVLDFKQYAKSMGVSYDIYRECDRLLGDMQHMEIPTRLLDWTTDPLSALYFACTYNDLSDDDKRNDCCVWVLDPWKWNYSIGELTHKGRIHDAHIMARVLIAYNWPWIEIWKFVDENTGVNLNKADVFRPFAVVNPFTSKRKEAQRGCFMVFGYDEKDLRMYRISS